LANKKVGVGDTVFLSVLCLVWVMLLQ